MSDSIFKLQLLARSELALTQIYTRRAATRTTYMAFALVLFLLGLGMFNFSAFLALKESYSPAASALIVACANGITAVIVLVLSKKAGPSDNEERMAREIREMAYREVSEDVDDCVTDICGCHFLTPNFSANGSGSKTLDDQG